MKKGNKTVLIIAIATIFIITSSALMQSVRADPTIGTNTDVTNNPYAQNEPNIAINPLHNTLADIHVAVGVNDYRGGAGNSVPGLYTSTDLTTWTYYPVSTPSYTSYGNPVLAYDSLGNLYYAYMAFNVDYYGNPSAGAIYVSKSTTEGTTWAFYTCVSGLGGSQGYPNCNPYYDRPWMAIDQATNDIYVSWTVWHGLNGSCVGSDVMFARSTDGGATFSTPITLSSGGYMIERQWSKIAIGPSGEVYVTWRRIGGPGGATDAILMAKSTNNGQTFSTEQVVAQYPEFQADDFQYYQPSVTYPATCTWPQIAVGPEGNLYLAWSGLVSNGVRNIYFIRSTDDGASWSSPTDIAGASSTFDQFWPVITVTSSGRVDVVWYDRRDDPSNSLVNLYYTYSLDGGQTFAPITKVTTAQTSTSVGSPTSTLYFGDYIDMAETADGAALPVWTDTRLGNQEAYIAAITITGAAPVSVVPEVPFGTIIACLSMLIALVWFAGFRRFRPKFQQQKINTP